MTALECEVCAEPLPSKLIGGYYFDGERITCACGVTSRVSVDEDGAAYVAGWTCRHGLDEETMCIACEADAARERDDRRQCHCGAANESSCTCWQQDAPGPAVQW